MSNTIQNAETLYAIIDGQHVDDTAFIGSMQMMAGSNPNTEQTLSQRPLIESTLRNQKGTAKLLKKWRQYFFTDIAINDQQANDFVSELLAGLEDVGQLLAQRAIVTGSSSAERGSYSDYPVSRPYHKPGWTLHITTEGSGSYNCVRQQIQSKPGDLLLFSPNSYFDHRRHQSSDRWQHQWILFQPQTHWLMWLQWPQIGPGIYQLDILQPQVRQQAAALFSDIVSIHDYSDNLANDLRKNLLEQLLIRCCQALPSQHNEPMDERISNIIDTLGNNFEKTISIDDLAEQASLSNSRLSALFKQYTGTSIVKWRDEQRMSRACQLLSLSSKPINEIAEHVGYKDPLYFTRCFRQHFACSPRQYRKQRLAQ